MQLADLIQRLRAISIDGPVDREITGLRYDSRRVGPGNLFVAVGGSCFDGHSFIEQAVDKGAVAIVGEKPGLSKRATMIVVPNSREALARLAATYYGDPSRRLKVIGVTGTNGKSTTTFLVKHLLERANQSTGLIGTVRYEIGERVLPAQRTTPESLDLQELLSQCVEAGCRNVVLEVSSHALSQGRASEIAFDVGAFTNLTQDHLDFHHGMKDYFEAKARLFDSVRDNQKKERAAVINIDDPYGQQLVARFGRDLPMISYGMGARAQFRASNFKVEMNGTSYQLNAKEKSYLVRLPLIGRFNVYNSLAALAVAHAIGADVRTSVLALANAPQIPGRLEAIPAKRQFHVFVDYAHTDDALLNVLRTCRDLHPNRLILVFGCGGNRDRTKRVLMGAVADQYADYAILTSDNPRKEDPEAIVRDIEAGFKRKNYEKIVDRREAISRAIALAQPKDIVLIAGKGHEKYQEFGDHTIPFDDVEVAARALEEHPVELSRHGS
ncbi:MAG TPA: UDP-N-acetylmuramoyl-L-alanyl-D-glutamate--2,6-diaminopimelate ligase [Chthoniobacterales bacterium]|jgi:UDP-N-acetylmuramoyl-L-alanyl-D-glutamate--2,6-diaminopimelate ligase|nr:UDP-N-acetylmuramoyl-L-alanyl-D-glutamate--2,6-diaminopimelate ligase [Chthoniobacterales bacterium]